jgi:hypothetical protein
MVSSLIIKFSFLKIFSEYLFELALRDFLLSIVGLALFVACIVIYNVL